MAGEDSTRLNPGSDAHNRGSELKQTICSRGGQGGSSRAGGKSWLLLAACLLLLTLQPSNQSLWIDEGGTADYALQPTFRAWVNRLAHDPIPNCQMPLSMFLSWVGAHTLGSAEWQLRAVNLLWAAGSLVAVFYAGRALGCAWLPALLFVQPYFWFYNNEARPYALEIFCGALLLAGAGEFWRQQGKGTRWAWTLALGGILLGYTTLLAPFPLAAIFTVCGVVAYRNGWRIDRKCSVPVALAVVLLVPMGLYYSWTIRRGVTFPVFWKGGWKALAYVFYELTGLTGLGPPTFELREAAQTRTLAAALQQHIAEFSLVAFTAACWLALLFAGTRQLVKERRWHAFAFLILIPLASGIPMTVVGLLMKKMLWARHWAPLFPFYVAAMGLALKACISKPGGPRRGAGLLAGTWLALLLCSALSLRFSAKHGKDDYRMAASLAREYSAKGHPVYWAASWDCAAYYRLSLDAPTSDSVLPFPYVPVAGNLSNRNQQLQPVVFLSRASIYDREGLVRTYATRHGMSCEEGLCHAFSIWLPRN